MGKHSQLCLIRLLPRQLGKVSFLRQWMGLRATMSSEVREKPLPEECGKSSAWWKKVERRKPKARANGKTKQKADNVTKQQPENKTNLATCKALWIAEHRRAYWWEKSIEALRSLQIDGSLGTFCKSLTSSAKNVGRVVIAFLLANCIWGSHRRF